MNKKRATIISGLIVVLLLGTLLLLKHVDNSASAIPNAETSSPTIDRSPIVHELSIILRIFMLKPDSKIRIGRKI